MSIQVDFNGRKPHLWSPEDDAALLEAVMNSPMKKAGFEAAAEKIGVTPYAAKRRYQRLNRRKKAALASQNAPEVDSSEPPLSEISGGPLEKALARRLRMDGTVSQEDIDAASKEAGTLYGTALARLAALHQRGDIQYLFDFTRDLKAERDVLAKRLKVSEDLVAQYKKRAEEAEALLGEFKKLLLRCAH